MTTTSHAVLPPHVPPTHHFDFDVYNPAGVEDDLQMAWQALQQPGVPDLVWTSRYGGHWIPTRGALVAQIFADSENFSNRLALVPREIGELHFGIPQSLDPPDHAPFRSLVNQFLSPRAVREMEQDIRQQAAALIENLMADGHCDFVRDYAYVLPVTVFLRMAGLPLEDRVRLQSLNDNIIRPSDATLSIEEASRQLVDYLRAPVLERRANPGPDIFSQMVSGRVHGRPLSEDEALNITKLVLQGGLDTVSNLLAFVFRYLSEQPGLRSMLAEQPEQIGVAVEEFVRRFPVTVQTRIAKRDVSLAGVTLRAGDAVVLGTMLHGLDARANDEPFRVDLHRARREHSTFGKGIHNCPGAHLAKLELRITLEEWLRRIPRFERAPGSVRCRGGLVGGLDRLPLRWDTGGARQQAE